ncbi:MAG: type 1 glutamine amidotransferase, partial [Bdellovibrionales bacterium]|nr:type 1 glutamine amidotransferase [Bdellovibrionales bacterium]
MRLHIIQHVPFETAAGVQRWALAQGFQIETTFGDLVEEYPTVDCFDALVVMGGPMGVYESDRFPWLLEELALVRRATAAGKKVLGICLGAQIIAEALGGKVYPGPVKEIGWFPARLTAEGRKAEVLAEFPDTFSPL